MADGIRIGLRTGRVGPVADQTVEFPLGLTVLYGLNGAGKSSLLGALMAAVLGRMEEDQAVDVGATHLLFQVGDEPFRGLLAPLLSGVKFPPHSMAEFLNPLIRQAWPDCPDDILGEVADARTIAAFPVGDATPSWDLWLCASRSGTRPSGRELAKARAAWSSGTWTVLEAIEYLLQQGLREDTAAEAPADSAAGLAAAILKDPKRAFEAMHSSAELPIRGYLEALGQSVRSPLDVDRWWRMGDADDLPVPFIRLGRTHPMQFPVVAENDIDVARDTRRHVRQLAIEHRQQAGLGEGQGHHPDLEDDFDIDEAAPWAHSSDSILGGRLGELVGRANEHYQDLHLGAPRLELTIGDYVDWVSGEPFTWKADGHPIERLSRAQARWAGIAIALAMQDTPGLVVLDEPESALHRSAEDHMARGLAQLAAQGHTVVVATHSPALLDHQRAHVLECRKTDQRTAITPLSVVHRERLDDLGLHPSDLLKGIKSFILVEGLHDKTLLQIALAEQLRAGHAKVLPLSGGPKLNAALDGPMLVDYTTAKLIAVLDNVEADLAIKVLDTAHTIAETDSASAAMRYVANNLQLRNNAEAGWLVGFINSAIERGLLERIQVCPMSRQDIIEYLPVTAFIAENRTWESLRAEYSHLTSSQAKRPDFKKLNRPGVSGDSLV